MERVSRHIVDWLKSYCEQSNLNGFVIGVSGGIDSAVTSILCAETGKRVVLLNMPIRQQSSEFLLAQKHIEDLGYTVLNSEPKKEERLTNSKIIRLNSKIAYPAFRTDTQTKEGKWLTKIIKDYFSESPVIIRTSGGSVPISPFVSELGVPAIGVPTVNLDNNQHSPNENIRVGNYLKGIETYLAILTTNFK